MMYKSDIREVVGKMISYVHTSRQIPYMEKNNKDFEKQYIVRFQVTALIPRYNSTENREELKEILDFFIKITSGEISEIDMSKLDNPEESICDLIFLKLSLKALQSLRNDFYE